MKINNKGFATSILLYGLLIVFLIVFATLLIIVGNSTKLDNLIKNNLLNNIQNSDDSKSSDIEYIFEYNGTSGSDGSEQIFVVPENGTYKLETWGAQGGSVNEIDGGYGGYSKGEIKLNKGDILYINVGGKGISGYVGTYTVEGGYNGGGSNTGGSFGRGASGGGATHISLKSGLLSTLSENTDDVLIASGGGGGAGVETENNSLRSFFPGNGGGYSGTSGEVINYPEYTESDSGNQIGGYAFGQGENSQSWAGAGGGGFYGGFGKSTGAGGSGYIANTNLTNKVMYCYNCAESSIQSEKTISTTNVSLNPISTYAKKGNGYAKITRIGELPNDIEEKKIDLLKILYNEEVTIESYDMTITKNSDGTVTLSSSYGQNGYVRLDKDFTGEKLTKMVVKGYRKETNSSFPHFYMGFINVVSLTKYPDINAEFEYSFEITDDMNKYKPYIEFCTGKFDIYEWYME